MTSFYHHIKQFQTQQPSKTALSFVRNIIRDNDGISVDEVSLTYRELFAQAELIAAHLIHHTEKSDRVLLLFPSCLEFVTSFVACLQAGVIAVPAFAPGNQHYLSRLVNIIHDAKPTTILTLSKHQQACLDFIAEQNLSVTVLSVDALASISTDVMSREHRADDDVIFLQYTSGSTSTPKGVMITNKNLMTNHAMIKTAFAHDGNTVLAGWLPLFHDMGLIGNVLQPLYCGAHAVFMSPLKFIQRPARWLWLVDHYKATTTGAPNFAYQSALEKVTPEQCEGLDLSTLKIAYCGAEPIRAKTLEAFAEQFSVLGFSKNALYPVYGLAEATLLVSGGVAGEGMHVLDVERHALEHGQVTQPTTKGIEIVSCGQAIGDERIIIIDSEHEVGEIAIAGEHVTPGYWQNEGDTADAFITIDGTRYLRTGDLGFIANNQLYITGRKKDVIIIRGVNHYPEDIENTVLACLQDYQHGNVAALSHRQSHQETFIVMIEMNMKKNPGLSIEKLKQTINQQLSDIHGIVPSMIVYLKPGELPRTSSGKLQRQQAKQQMS